LSQQPLPEGRRVGIITNAGGPAILCADACETERLTVPELSPDVQKTLSAFLPSAAALRNPVDLIASATPEQYRQAIETLLATHEIDALVIIYISVTAGDQTAVARGIETGILNGRASGANTKPVMICWMAEGDGGRTFLLPSETIPTYGLPERPALVLGTAARYADWRRQPTGIVPEFDDLDLAEARRICATAVAERGPGWLSTEESRELLNTVRLPLQPGGLAHTADEAAALAARIGFPVAVKLASRELVHKTELGGVRLGLATEAAVRDAFAAIRARMADEGRLDAMDGVLVQPMVSGGLEVMVGMTQDPLFGPLIAFGLGGIHVEILGDVQFRITPLTDRDASEMVRGIKGFRLLAGYRGHPPADIEAIDEILLRVSRLVEDVPGIIELDFNPLFALPPGQGCRIVDARIRVGRAE
jgi:acyl-CoA synthetase (NDP forming)